MSQTPNSDTLTRGIRIRAAAQFLADQSDPDRSSYLYAYRIVIENQGDMGARLRSRHWIIRDADGNRQDVRGAGVVGEHPWLDPTETFEYTSNCPLPTPWGTMEGSYTFESDDGERFEVEIGRFFLVPSAPELLRR